MRAKERGSASETDPLIPKESRWWRTNTIALSAMLGLMLIIAAFFVSGGLVRESPVYESVFTADAPGLGFYEYSFCETLHDGSLKVNAVGNGKTQTSCRFRGRHHFFAWLVFIFFADIIAYTSAFFVNVYTAATVKSCAKNWLRRVHVALLVVSLRRVPRIIHQMPHLRWTLSPCHKVGATVWTRHRTPGSRRGRLQTRKCSHRVKMCIINVLICTHLHSIRA